jgi:signal transduction histidine kinase
MTKGLTTIITQVERINKVMKQLLAFARRRSPEWRTVDLGEIVDDTLEMFQERIAESCITIDKAIESSLPPVRADRDQLIQVLINLVMNSIHAMPQGGQLKLSRYRPGDAGRDPFKGIRAVFHDERFWEGHRSRPYGRKRYR